MTAPSLRIALVALSVGLVPACKGPDAAGPTTFDVVDPGMLAVQWQDGPRRENAQLEVQKNAREIALRLFPDAPMGAQGANTALDAFGDFKSEVIPVSVVGLNAVRVQQILDRVGYK